MNSSQNITYHDLEYWFCAYGQPWIMDYLYVYTLLPFFLISFGFSLLSYYVLWKKEFNNNSFFKYTRAFVLNSIFLFAILTTSFIAISRRVFNFTNTYEAIDYATYFYIPVLSMFYLNSSLIEICLVIERLLYFLPVKYKRVKTIGFEKLSLILIILSVIISLPNYFLFYPTYMDVKLDVNTTFRLYYGGNTEFTSSFTGLVMLALMYFIRDILTLVVKIILNIKLIIMVRNYLNKIKREKLEFALKISSGSELHGKIVDGVKNVNESGYISKTERNQTYIALSMCIFSLFNHLFFTLSYILSFLKSQELAGITIYLTLVSLGLKHVSNFFILYKYKYLFRNKLKRSLRFLFPKKKTNQVNA